MEDRIVQHIGDACQLINELKGPFDLVFMDADKREYCEYYNLVFDKVPVGGFILADNILWSGKVAEEKPDADEQTQVFCVLMILSGTTRGLKLLFSRFAMVFQ
jgi:predicted O-methyltransferase YrrM